MHIIRTVDQGKHEDETLVGVEEGDENHKCRDDGGTQDDDQSSELEDVAEDLSIYLKAKDERMEVLEEIEELCALVPQLSSDYKLVDRLGNGCLDLPRFADI